MCVTGIICQYVTEFTSVCHNVMYVWITVRLYVPILTFLYTLLSAVQRASNTCGRSVFKYVRPHPQTFRTIHYLPHAVICLHCIWWPQL